MSTQPKLILPSRMSGNLVSWRGSGGEVRLSVVCRASYRLVPGTVTSLAQVSGPGGVQAPFKSATDVVVVGQGGGGSPGRLEVGDVEKHMVAIDGQLSGTGPLDAESPERRRWLGRHADWREEQLAEQGFPGDADWRYWNIAPVDQQLGRPLVADERIVVAAPGQEPLTTRLSGERAVAYAAPRATASNAEAEPVDMLADTLWIDLDRGLCTVSWRGQLEPSADGVMFLALMRGDVDFDQVRRSTQSGPSSPLSARTAERPIAVDREALPFMAKPTGKTVPPRPATSKGEARVETGTVGAAELQAALGSLTPEQREVAPWFAAPKGASPSTPGATNEPQASAWSNLRSPLPRRPSAPPPPPRPSAPPPLNAPPTPAAAPPRAVLSPATFAAASVGQAAPSKVPVAPPTRQEPTPASPALASEHTQLIWFEPSGVERVRAYFSDLVDELDFVEPDPKRDLVSEDPAEAKAHHHCLGILSRGRPGGSRSLHEAFGDASAEGAFVAPITLVEGRLQPSFDTVAKVQRLVALLEPLALGDDKLQGELDQVRRLIESPYSLRVGGTADRISRQLEQLFTPKHRAAVEGIEGKVRRLLLEDRAFATPTIFGAPHLRATLTCGDADEPVIAYLPEAAADQLPLFASFPCRLLAEVHPRQDESEGPPLALSVVALGRLLRQQDVSRWRQSRRSS